MKCLENEANVPGPERVKVNLRAKLGVLEENFAAGRTVESSEQVKECRLAAAAWSGDGEIFAGGNGEIHTAQSLDAPVVIAHAQAAHFECGATHVAAPPRERGARRATRASPRR